MKRSEYKRLGDYILPTMEKNVGLKVRLSQGINNNKYFQNPRQVAQDSENDQIVRRGQFAFNKATTRNGEKISIAYRDGEDCTVSSAYQVFYIKNEEQLNPYYLMMWFKRPEFDRYARFKSHGSAHEFFTFEEMCNVLLPVPSIEEQRRIVNEYQTVERRIKNNEAMIKKLEETAQAIYHHTFVEGIDENNLPEGWRMGTIKNLVTTQYGYTATSIIDNTKPKILRITDIVPPNIVWEDVPNCEIKEDEIETYKLQEGDIVVSRTGQNIGYAKQIIAPVPDSVFASFLVRLKPNSSLFNWFLGILIESSNYKDFIFANQQGSAQPQANPQVMTSYPVVIPTEDTLSEFNKKVYPILKYRRTLSRETSHLRSLLSLLTSKLS